MLFVHNRSGAQTPFGVFGVDISLHNPSPDGTHRGSLLPEPSPLRGRYTFRILLPPSPTAPMRALGLPVEDPPLYVCIKPGDDSTQFQQDNDVCLDDTRFSFVFKGANDPTNPSHANLIEVTLDLTDVDDSNAFTLERKLEAAWVSPCGDNFNIRPVTVTGREVRVRHDGAFGPVGFWRLIEQTNSEHSWFRTPAAAGPFSASYALGVPLGMETLTVFDTQLVHEGQVFSTDAHTLPPGSTFNATEPGFGADVLMYPFYQSIYFGVSANALRFPLLGNDRGAIDESLNPFASGGSGPLTLSAQCSLGHDNETCENDAYTVTVDMDVHPSVTADLREPGRQLCDELSVAKELIDLSGPNVAMQATQSPEQTLLPGTPGDCPLAEGESRPLEECVVGRNYVHFKSDLIGNKWGALVREDLSRRMLSGADDQISAVRAYALARRQDFDAFNETIGESEAAGQALCAIVDELDVTINGMNPWIEFFADPSQPLTPVSPSGCNKNDSCVDGARPPFDLEQSGTWAGVTSGYANDLQPPCLGASGQVAPDAFHNLHLENRARVNLATSGSNFDTVLYVQQRSGPAHTCHGTPVANACNDDWNGTLQSRVTAELEAGDYSVVVDGYGASAGNYSLTMDVLSDQCDEARSIPSAPGTYSFTGSTSTFFLDDYQGTCAWSNSADVVYRLKLTEARRVVLRTAGSDFDTVMYVAPASACFPGILTPSTDLNGVSACNDDTNGAWDRTSTLDLLLPAGEYVVVVDGWGTSSRGNFNLIATIQ